MDASVQVTSTRHLGTSMPSRGRPPHHYRAGYEQVYRVLGRREVCRDDQIIVYYRHEEGFDLAFYLK
jgi:hypothetical protein